MPLVKGLRDRVEKFTAKTPADQTGTRYGAVKDIAEGRFIGFASSIVEFRELVRIVLEKEGVPAGKQGVYYAFAAKLRKYAFSHSGATLEAIANGLIADFTIGKGADPAVLKKIATMVLGEVLPQGGVRRVP